MTAFKASDYRSGMPRRNAEIFQAIWPYDIHGVDDHGLFVIVHDGGGSMSLQDMCGYIAATDQYRRLTDEDIENTAAFLFHLAPDYPEDDSGEW
jgi:hypothetical protein